MDIDPKVAHVWELAEPIALEAGLEIVDIEHRREGRGTVLRFLMDKPGGVLLDELAVVSRQMSDVLDVHADSLSQSVGRGYTLEVSSPGVNRPLTRPQHFDAFVGKRVHVRTSEPVGDRQSFRGTLTAVASSGIVLTADDRSAHEIPFSAIARANYQHDFSPPAPPSGAARRGARARSLDGRR